MEVILAWTLTELIFPLTELMSPLAEVISPLAELIPALAELIPAAWDVCSIPVQGRWALGIRLDPAYTAHSIIFGPFFPPPVWVVTFRSRSGRRRTAMSL